MGWLFCEVKEGDAVRTYGNIHKAFPHMENGKNQMKMVSITGCAAVEPEQYLCNRGKGNDCFEDLI